MYDIPKDYINALNNVLIFYCGGLNNGHNKLREDYSWSIAAIKDHESYDLSKYDLVIIDNKINIRAYYEIKNHIETTENIYYKD